jgi:uncharacterized protein YneF (UPF0154 family)
MSGLSSAFGRVLLALLGAVSLAIGVRFGYTSYLSEKVLERCIAGGPCPLNINTLTLQSTYETTRGEVFLGVALAVLGVLVMMYSFLFAGRFVNRRIIQTDQK